MISSPPLFAPRAPPPLLQIYIQRARKSHLHCSSSPPSALKNQLAQLYFQAKVENDGETKYAKQITFARCAICSGEMGLYVKRERSGGGKSGINKITRVCVCMLANSILLCLQKSWPAGREREILRKQSEVVDKYILFSLSFSYSTTRDFCFRGIIYNKKGRSGT